MTPPSTAKAAVYRFFIQSNGVFPYQKIDRYRNCANPITSGKTEEKDTFIEIEKSPVPSLAQLVGAPTTREMLRPALEKFVERAETPKNNFDHVQLKLNRLSELSALPRRIGQKELWNKAKQLSILLSDEEPRVRASAARALGSFILLLDRPNDRLLFAEKLIGVLQDNTFEVFLSALKAVVHCIPFLDSQNFAKNWVRILEPLIHHRNKEIRDLATVGLLYLYPLDNELDAFEGFLRSLALIRRIDFIDPRLRSSSEELRRKVIHELENLKLSSDFNERRHNVLQMVALSVNDDPVIRASALNGLARLAHILPATPERALVVLPILLRLTDENIDVVWNALRGLEKVVPILVNESVELSWIKIISPSNIALFVSPFLEHSVHRVRDAAAHTIATIVPLISDEKLRLEYFDKLAEKIDDSEMHTGSLVKDLSVVLPTLSTPHQFSRTYVVEGLVRNDDPETKLAASKILDELPWYSWANAKRVFSGIIKRFVRIGRDIADD